MGRIPRPSLPVAPFAGTPLAPSPLAPSPLAPAPRAAASRAAAPRAAAALLIPLLMAVVLTTDPASTRAQDDLDSTPAEEPGALVADRPTNGSSPILVPDGYALFETGFAWEREELGDFVEFRQIRSLVTSLRLGVSRRFELQLNYSGQFETDLEDEARDVTIEANGEGDFELGAKILLTSADTAPVASALVVGLNLPTGDSRFGSTSYDPRAVLAVGRSLTGRLSVDVNVGADWQDGDLIDGLATTALGFALLPKWTLMVEHTASTPLEESGETAHSLLYAVAFLPTDRWQVDFFLGHGITEEAFDFFGGIGVVWRTP